MLSVGRVERLERLLGGDPVTEEVVLEFILARYGARGLAWIPEKIAEEIFRRPEDFKRAARRFKQPELF